MTPEQRRDLSIVQAEHKYRRRLESINDEMRSAGKDLDEALAAANQRWLQEIDELEAIK